MPRNFEQKRRNKPIIITDIAISKVPMIQFQGFSEEENIFVQQQHMRLLRKAKDDNQSCEVGILVDIIKWNTWIIIGESNNIEMKTNPEAYKAMVTQGINTMMFMHNHPSTGTFSGTDFKTFCNHESLFIMTVVGNDGNVKVLTKQSKFNAADALLYYYELVKKYNKYENNSARAMKELLKNCNQIGLVYVR